MTDAKLIKIAFKLGQKDCEKAIKESKKLSKVGNPFTDIECGSAWAHGFNEALCNAGIVK